MSDNNKILLVEDDQPLVDAITKKLELEGFDYVLATDGSSGLSTAYKEKPDLILLDIVLPLMDGITFLNRLRQDDEWGKKVPVIILTNLTKADTEEEIKDKGVREYLVKTDWSLDEVIAKIKDELENV